MKFQVQSSQLVYFISATNTKLFKTKFSYAVVPFVIERNTRIFLKKLQLVSFLLKSAGLIDEVTGKWNDMNNERVFVFHAITVFRFMWV